MNSDYRSLLKAKMGETGYAKLVALENEKLFRFIGQYVELCEPDSVFMSDDSLEDSEYVRHMALELGEERALSITGHTIHYDGYGDQGRDKANTRFMVPAQHLKDMKFTNCVEFTAGLAEIHRIARGIMRGKRVAVKLFCEGPAFSPFTRPCVQITDSWYVAHSEQILYRPAYQHFKQMARKDDFYCFVHSAGELDERGCSINLDKRRVYIDTENLIVYSMNNQYAGNSLGLKKHAMRLAIKQAGEEGWLCEHMFIMGCQVPEKKRVTYFCGAFPSACGKTSTAMLPGEKIVGDDIAYFRNIAGEFRAVNVEQGIFGIIRDVNQKDDPVIWSTLHSEREVIFSNVLVSRTGRPFWLGMGIPVPAEGENHSGPGWHAGQTDAAGKEIPVAHSNARYTIRMEYLDNIDSAYQDRAGVHVGGIMYGGRDSDTMVPVEQSPSWQEGILLKACTLESETTSATLGKEGVLVPNLMANKDFISYPIGRYIMNNINFVKDMRQIPPIFTVNYFLRRPDGRFCNSMLAKRVWLHWAELRVHGEAQAWNTPTGMIPRFEDLARLFKDLLHETYTLQEYDYQFQFRCDRWLDKLHRAEKHFRQTAPDLPEWIYSQWEMAKRNICAAQERYGVRIKPGDYKEKASCMKN